MIEKAAAVVPGIEKSVNHQSSTYLRHLEVHANLVGFWAALEDEFHPREDGRNWYEIFRKEGAEELKNLVFEKGNK